jgi:D-alanine transaminase
MSRIAYVNGRYVPHGDAAVHIEDRGYQFADAVYEVCEVRDGRLLDEPRHMARLARSLGELAIGQPMTPAALGVVMREVVRRNSVRDGFVYVQVSRGVAPRDHGFPRGDVPPAVVVTARRSSQASRERQAEQGVAVITLADERWARVDIKTVGLLPNVLAKQKAREAGAYEAWLVDADGFVTEGASTNAWIVTGEGTVVTRPAGRDILRGVTRTGVLDLAALAPFTLEERPFTVAEALAAREAFLTSASSIVTSVVRIDGKPVGDGRPGPVARKLRSLFRQHVDVAKEWANGADALGRIA